MIIRRLLIYVMIFTVLGQPARAAVDQAGADRLRTLFQGLLDEQGDKATVRGGKLAVDGKVMVEPAGNYYAITMPHLSIEHNDGSRLDIGMIALNAMPGDKPEQWKMTMAIPTPLTYYDETGKPAIAVDVGKQNFAGVWHEKSRNYIRLQAQYRDIAVKAMDGAFTATLPEFSAVYDLNEDGGGATLSGPMTLTANGLDIAMGDGGTAKIAKIHSRVDIDRYDLNAAAAYREKIEALAESYEAGDDSANPSHMSGLYNMVAEFIGTVWNGFAMTMTAEGVHMTRPPIPGSPPGELRLDNTSLAFGMTGFREGSVTMTLGAGYKDLFIAPLPEGFDSTTPSTVKIDLALNKLPYREIVELGRATVGNAAQSPDMTPMLGLQALAMLPQLLTQAQTNLTVRDTFLGNKDYAMLVNGVLNADLKALKSATGTATVEITGFERLIAGVNAEIQKPDIDPAKAGKLKQVLSTLTILQIAGQQQGDAKRIYNFELTQQGQMLLNGADMSALMQAAPAP